MELFTQRYISRFILIPCLYLSEVKLTIVYMAIYAGFILICITY